MPRIAIVDPALGRTGVHNRGFASLLLDQGARPRDLGVWCNTAIDTGLQQALTSRGMTIDPTFDLDFYRIADERGGIAGHWDWVHALARNYREAFQRIADRWPSGPIHLLHHSLSWEHASALALALRLPEGRFDRLLHHAFLMYSPGIDADRNTFDPDRRLDYRLAFKGLDGLPGVRLYAGCGEYAAAYAQLLEHPFDLPLHPCFLGDWRSPPPHRRRDGIRNILLYLGEIKQQKGFLSLPRVLSALLDRASPVQHFIVQFVEPRNQAAQRILESLQEIAERDPRVEVHHGFWDESTLHETLQSADALCLNYDASAYAHKTSGLLWLAAWYGLTVWVPPDTWLEREARRLGMSVVAGVDQIAAGDIPSAHRDSDPGYFWSLFTPLWDWLERECVDLERGMSSATLPVEPVQRGVTGVTQRSAGTPGPTSTPEPGADIVLFWKQNDSCLYGRHHDMVAQYLATRSDVRRVIVVDAPIGEANLARLLDHPADVTQGPSIHALVRHKERGACDTGKLRYRVFVCPAGKYRFSDDDTERPHFLEGYTAFLRDAFECESIDPQRAVFWIYPKNFYAPYLLQTFRPGRVVVDVEDDHRAWPGVTESARLQLTANYRALLQAADMAFANCAPLQESMRAYCPDIRLVPNGCDTSPSEPSLPDNPLFRRVEQHHGKIIGYVGNLETKIDIPLLHKVAERFTECLVVLAGSTHANPQVLELRRHSNVLMPGVVRYDQLGAWLRRFDVGLVPHLETELTRYMNPQKLYVYLSWNVPVVATRVPNLDVADGLVRIADTHEQFLQDIAMTLDGPRPDAATFRAFVSANSWDARLSRHVDELNLAML